MSEHTATVIVSLVTLIGVCLTAVLGYLTNRHTRVINDAVNQRHSKRDDEGNMPPKMYDLAIANDIRTTRVEKKVDELRDWKRGYDGSAFPNAKAINDFVSNFHPCSDCEKFPKNKDDLD